MKLMVHHIGGVFLGALRALDSQRPFGNSCIHHSSVLIDQLKFTQKANQRKESKLVLL